MIEAKGINRRLAIQITESVRLRLAKYTSTQPTERGCLNWIGSNRQGYGAIKIDKKVYGAHCVAFVASGREILDGHVVAHKCDNRLCVNPNHLECVTIQKNNQDAQVRRRITPLRGREVPKAVLNPELVRTIRHLYVPNKFSYMRIAKLLNVPLYAVKSVVDGNSWTHVQ
ncbi:MAG: HNH endonuclease signature motif containing protein [Pirellula sp.]|jgi:hypothetical protein